jgi:catechol 2,3-dioxygenase-like lactoylglutathione lyase family enzyme
MTIKHLLFIPAFALVVACGNGKTEEKAEGMDHSGHDHSAMEHGKGVIDTTGLGVAYPEGSQVYFSNLVDGQQIKLPFTLQMGIEGMEVEPAGPINYGRGHHHIIIDGSFMAAGSSVPFDGQHIHFGKGQTEFQLDSLTVGKHTLTLQFANGAHLSYGEGLSNTITVEVVK